MEPDTNLATAGTYLLENERRSLIANRGEEPAPITVTQYGQLLGRVIGDEIELARLRGD
jgi:hypothetical protein